MIGVYGLLNILTGEMYIGSSSDIVDRFKNHFSSMKRGTHQTKRVREAVAKYGVEIFSPVVLEECSPEVLLDRETYWMNSIQPEYNVLLEATPLNTGVTRPAEFRAELSERNKGNTYNLGHTRSEESRALQSKARKGKPWTKAQWAARGIHV